ncbi:MAG: ABC transporter ATP-binding protein [Sedimentibacter sp.]|uniref:ABC transporter ATP-binding protein n=1 Tax=Sedimentibacter sp. TaxID=1960295 RepID=UPI0031580138
MISLMNVSSGYKNNCVIKNLNVEFGRGKITSIIGRNGCGKTTLLKTASGLIRPDAGDVFLQTASGKRKLLCMKHNEIAKYISFLPQNRDIPCMTVHSLVKHGRFPHLNFSRILQKKDLDAVHEAIEAMSLTEFSNKNLRELSGGQRQKAYLAMVLAQNTDIIFLDEPTAYLDISHQLEMIQTVKKLKNLGKTVVMVLHDINLALASSDSICIMDNGEIKDFGTPEMVLQNNTIDQILGVSCVEVPAEFCGMRQYIFKLRH